LKSKWEHFSQGKKTRSSDNEEKGGVGVEIVHGGESTQLGTWKGINGVSGERAREENHHELATGDRCKRHKLEGKGKNWGLVWGTPTKFPEKEKGPQSSMEECRGPLTNHPADFKKTVGALKRWKRKVELPARKNEVKF